MRGADAEAEDALLVEQGVDHPAGAEALVELGGDVVDSALGPDILAGDDDVAVREHQIGERPAQQPRHVLRLVHHAPVAREQGLALLRVGVLARIGPRFGGTMLAITVLRCWSASAA